jgi:hypothetical protein
MSVEASPAPTPAIAPEAPSLDLPSKALRAVEILLTHWDHEHFRHAKDEEGNNANTSTKNIFVPRSAKTFVEYQDPNEPLEQESKKKIENGEQEHEQDEIDVEGMHLSDSSSVLNLHKQIPDTEKKMIESLPEVPTGLGGVGVWKYKTEMRSLDERRSTAQFYTVWSTPTKTAPVPRAMAGVWFTYRGYSEEERKVRYTNCLIFSSHLTCSKSLWNTHLDKGTTQCRTNNSVGPGDRRSR